MGKDLNIKEPVAGMSFFNAGSPAEPFAWLQSSKKGTGHFTYAEGYKQAVHVLVRVARRKSRDNPYLDTIMLPLFFLIRHYVELRIKGMLWIYALIERQGWEYEEGHKLEELWRKCRKIFDDRPSFSCNHLDLIEGCILELHRYDPNSEAFRYAYSKKRTEQKKYLEGLPDHINYKNVLDVFERLDTGLEGMCGSLTAEYEARNEEQM